MMRNVTTTVALALLTSAAAALGPADVQQPMQVKTSHGTFDLTVNITQGDGENVAYAMERSERDGVMVIPMNADGEGYALVCEISHETQGSSTVMVDQDGMGDVRAQDWMPSDPFAPFYVSAWFDADGHPHVVRTAPMSDENFGGWAWRHLDGTMVMRGVHAPGETQGDVQSGWAEFRRPVAETAWNDAMGMQHEVSTPKRDNESDENWRQRHARAVSALAEVCPPSTDDQA